MTSEEFFAEAQRLAKPCRHYRIASIGETVSGYWHGIQSGKPCISIERQGKWLNVSLDESGESGCVQVSDQPVLSQNPLFRRDTISLPPIDAIFRFGSHAIEKYLELNGWKRDWEFNDNFKGAAAHEYEREWMKNCPLYANDIIAMEGGWSVPWPDGDWGKLQDFEFVLCTFAESEPWVEVFSDGKQYHVFQRIT